MRTRRRPGSSRKANTLAKGVSLKERRFVDAYLGSCNGNATEAALAAGYTANRKSASVLGVRLLGKVKIRALVQAREKKLEVKEILTADQRDKRLSQIASQSKEDAHVISAIKELNKCSGRHSIKHVLDVTEKLSDIIAASRGPS